MSHPLPSTAVTGATGAVGGAVARSLAAAGVAQRLLVRDVARAPELSGARPIRCSYSGEPETVRALEGVETLLMVSASESADRLSLHRAFVDAAQAAGVAHIVYTSFAGAAPDAVFTLGRDHFATEQHILAARMGYTFLRDNLYLDFLEEMVGDDGVIRGPADDGRVAAVARADVARTAAVVLQDVSRHRDVAYTLTGPEALTLAEVAEMLSAARGTRVSYHPETISEAYESRRKWNAPDWQLDAWVSTYTAIAAGEVAAVTDHVLRVTGQRPQSLAELLAAGPP